MTNAESTERGTVKLVRLPDPQRGEPEPVMDGRIPALESPVVVELHGHAHRYVVRVARTEDGPVLTELRVVSDNDAPIDYAVMRAVNLRRLIFAALQWLTSAGGQFAQPGDTAESFTKPEKAADIRRRRTDDYSRLTDVAAHVEDALDAIKAGDKEIRIQKFVADRLGVGPAQAQRLIRKAKDQGFLADKQLPRRK